MFDGMKRIMSGTRCAGSMAICTARTCRAVERIHRRRARPCPRRTRGIAIRPEQLCRATIPIIDRPGARSHTRRRDGSIRPRRVDTDRTFAAVRHGRRRSIHWSIGILDGIRRILIRSTTTDDREPSLDRRRVWVPRIHDCPAVRFEHFLTVGRMPFHRWWTKRRLEWKVAITHVWRRGGKHEATIWVEIARRSDSA